jgi:GNAT superfamily N-acetyltransferase
VSSDLVVRDATAADRDDAVALLEAAHGSQVRTPEAWDWLFRGRLERYVVADAGDKLAAQYALLPLRVQHRGAVIDASLSLDTATHPDFTGRGLMTDLGLRAYNRAGGELVLGFPNLKSAGILYNRLGWSELTPFPLLFRPLAGLIQALTPATLRAGPVVDALARSIRRNRDQTAEPLERFDGWADDIWEATSAELGTTVVRDSTFLNWRFVEAPVAYDRFVASVQGKPSAYSVLRTVPWRNGRVSYLMELAALPGREGAAASALAAAKAAADAVGSGGIIAIATPRNPLNGFLRAHGFRRVPERARAGFSFGARLSGALEEHAELKRLDAWHITAADFDHV